MIVFTETDDGARESAKQSSRPTLPASAEQLLNKSAIRPMTAETIQGKFWLVKKALIERSQGEQFAGIFPAYIP